MHGPRPAGQVYALPASTAPIEAPGVIVDPTIPAAVAPVAPTAPVTAVRMDEAGVFCPSLPSSETANAVLEGRPGALWLLGRDLVVRGALVTVGVYAVDRWGFGERDLKKSFYRGIGGAVGIEVFVLAWMYYKKWSHKNGVATPF